MQNKWTLPKYFSLFAYAGFWKHIGIRAALILPTVFILVSLVFFLMRATGDPITASVGDRLPKDELQKRIADAGYDRPLLVQYWEYLVNIAQGNFGITVSTNEPVLSEIAKYAPATIELTLYAFIIALILGITLGRVAAFHLNKWQDLLLRVFSIFTYATPIFFTGLLLKLIFAINLQILPLSGRLDPLLELELSSSRYTGIYLIDAIIAGRMDLALGVLQHAFLPALALGFLITGVFLRVVRANIASTLTKPYILAARSRGVPERRLLRVHAYKPALATIVTVVGLQLAALLGGAVLTETTFEWRGIGFLLVDFIKARDFAAVQGVVALIAILVALINFLVDVILALVDPRIRASK